LQGQVEKDEGENSFTKDYSNLSALKKLLHIGMEVDKLFAKRRLEILS
jgi:hypothetical protein